jgi:hypothetical protein
VFIDKNKNPLKTVLKAAERNGWCRCPNCGNFVEKQVSTAIKLLKIGYMPYDDNRVAVTILCADVTQFCKLEINFTNWLIVLPTTFLQYIHSSCYHCDRRYHQCNGRCGRLSKQELNEIRSHMFI